MKVIRRYKYYPLLWEGVSLNNRRTYFIFLEVARDDTLELGGIIYDYEKKIKKKI